MPARIVPSATADHLLGGQTEKKEVFFPGLGGHLNRCAVARLPKKVYAGPPEAQLPGSVVNCLVSLQMLPKIRHFIQNVCSSHSIFASVA
jgi:hypothetical protein